MSVPVLIRIAMAKKGIKSNVELSKLSGVHVNTVSNIMNGKKYRSESLEKIYISMGYVASEFYSLDKECK